MFISITSVSLFFSQHELSFSPSMAVEFVTRMGVHIPKFVVSAVEMHTNMFHESSFNAKITKVDGQIKLSIPAPKGTTELFRVRYLLCYMSETFFNALFKMYTLFIQINKIYRKKYHQLSTILVKSTV